MNDHPAGNISRPGTGYVFRRPETPPPPLPETSRICFLCRAAIRPEDGCVSVLSAPGRYLCADCKKSYAFRFVRKAELAEYMRDRLSLLSRRRLLRLAAEAEGERAFLSWFYSGGFLETGGDPPGGRPAATGPRSPRRIRGSRR